MGESKEVKDKKISQYCHTGENLCPDQVLHWQFRVSTYFLHKHSGPLYRQPLPNPKGLRACDNCPHIPKKKKGCV